MVHAHHMEIGPGVDTVAHGNFTDVESALAAFAQRPYGPGHWQEIVDEEAGVRYVRAEGRLPWNSYRLPRSIRSDLIARAAQAAAPVLAARRRPGP